MFEIIDSLFSEIVIGIVMGSGGALLAYFKKLSSTQKSLCTEIQQLRKALIIKETEIDRQSNRLHEEANSDLEDLVEKILDKEQ